MSWFAKLAVFLGVRTLKKFHIRRNGFLHGTYDAFSEQHALNLMAEQEGHKNFENFCRVLGVPPETYRVETIKQNK